MPESSDEEDINIQENRDQTNQNHHNQLSRESCSAITL